MGDTESFWTNLPQLLTATGGIIAALAALVGALYSAKIIGGKRSSKINSIDETLQTQNGTVDNNNRTDENFSKNLRRSPATITWDMIEAKLITFNFFDKRRNANGSGVKHEYRAMALGDATVVEDGATGLMWQKGGSKDPMTLAVAQQYIQQLNTQAFAGYQDWQLPTVEEAMTLMEPQAVEQMHIDAVFNKGINFIWTSDKTPENRGWLLYFYDGILATEVDAFNAWVKAVRKV